MKKFRVLIIVLVSLFLVPICVDAQSIADYRAKIKEIEAEKAKNNAKSAAVQEKIDKANARIKEITREIAEAIKEQDKTREEIKQLQEEMKEKEEEIKDLVAFYQVSDNDNFYLKFIFGAEDFEDFIYRFAVAEQLTEANDKLVGEMNDLVKENKEKVKELGQQRQKLDKLGDEMDKQVAQLGSEKRKYVADALDADEEIDALKKQISYFKKKGCSENQDVSSCSSGLVPSSSGFQLPLDHAIITTYYGYQLRSDIGESTPRMHAGMDFGASCGSTMYASNSGEVIMAGWYYGYGNAVMIAHNVNGKVYTTLYGHMSSISVSAGQSVSRGQVIGAVGNTGYSFGCHLHFQIMYGTGYGTAFNPRNIMNVPDSW